MSLEDIVNIQISRQTTAVTKVGFGVMMFLSTHRVFSELAREYTSTTALTGDGFVATDDAVRAATAYFAQTKNGTPTKIIIGRRACDVSHVTFKTMTAIGQVQGVKINSTTFEFTSVTGAETAAAVATAVDALVNAGAEPVTSVDLGGNFAAGTITLTSDVADAGDTIVISSGSSSAVLPTLGHIPKNPLAIDDINAIQVINDTWYGLTFEDHRRAFARATMSAAAAAETAGLAINGTDFEFASAGGDDAVNVATNVATLINAGSEPVVAINNFDGTIDIVDDGTADNTANTVADSTNNTNANAFATIDPVIALATGIEAKKKLFGTSSGDATAISFADGTDTLSNAQRIDDANFARTFYIHDLEADTAFPEAAWIGHMFPIDPGAATWKFKTLATITSENLTETQRTNLHNKNANSYLEVGGVDITCEGTVGEGEYIDVIRGVDWLDARLTERIYSRLVNLPKIPFTNAGIAVIEAEIRAQLDEAIAVGFIAIDPDNHDGEPYTIIVPDVADISANDKALRTLTGLRFQATLAGAIHAVTVNGVVTV